MTAPIPSGADPSGGLPWGDWQFWVVTLLAIAAAWWLVRPFIPSKRRREKRGERRASLTIEGSAPGKGGESEKRGG